MSQWPTVAYRIGRSPDPLEYPPYEFCGRGRFDDPWLTYRQGESHFRVLYLGYTLMTCFIEILQGFRPDLAYIASIADLDDGDDDPDLPSDEDLADVARGVSSSWLRRKAIQEMPLPTEQLFDRIVDLSSQGMRENMRQQLAVELHSLGEQDFDLGTVITLRREVTQFIARYLHDSGMIGIEYPSRFGPGHTCLALFEGAPIDKSIPSEPIDLQGSDLQSALALFGLHIQYD
jgi:hypothetical protein